MRLIINILMVLSTLIAIFMIGCLIFGLTNDGFTGGDGMAILAFQLYGYLGSVGAILLGGISYAMGKKVDPQSTKPGKWGIALGIIGLLTLGAMMVSFG